MKYTKPALQRYGTFREVTRNFNWCWVFPDIPGLCTPPSSTTNPGGESGGEEGGQTGDDRS